MVHEHLSLPWAAILPRHDASVACCTTVAALLELRSLAGGPVGTLVASAALHVPSLGSNGLFAVLTWAILATF